MNALIERSIKESESRGSIELLIKRHLPVSEFGFDPEDARAYICIYIYTQAPESVNRSVANEKRRVMKYPWSLSPEIRISRKQGRVGQDQTWIKENTNRQNSTKLTYIYIVDSRSRFSANANGFASKLLSYLAG